MSWTLAHIEQLKAKGKIRDYSVLGNKNAQNSNKVAKNVKKIARSGKKVPEGLKFIMRILGENKIDFITEYRFHDVRKFRFDIALQPLKIAIEYEGVMSKKSRHTTNSGYTRDADKYNLAQQMGWKVYRYTTLNYKNFESDLKAIFNQ